MSGTGTCPKCHGLLETDESYICCAGATLQWRCRSCAKLSEGFAFPFGMCPHCAGKLEALERTGVEGAAGLDAIRLAFQIELGGQAFYERAAARTSDPLLSELFGRLAAMENEHVETLARRYHVTVPEPAAAFRIDLAAVQAGVDGRIDDPATLFRAAIAFEKRAVAFFGERAQSAPEGSPEQQLYRELGAEEVEHVAMLETELQRWSAGKAGLIAG